MEVEASIAGNDHVLDASNRNLLPHSVPRDANGRILPGHSLNPLGRIKKKPTVLDETVQLAHKAKNRRRIAHAWVNTMAEEGTAAGNRARADFSDRIYGLPKQTLVLEQGTDPLLLLLERMSERKQLPQDTLTTDDKT